MNVKKLARRAGAAVALVVAATALGEPRAYKAPAFAEAENFAAEPFLPVQRQWERVEVHVPKVVDGKPAPEKLPCVVLFYGGGWGEKVTGGLAAEMKALVGRGYVVAMPDYLLGASQPVPAAVWDGAAAIRFLRANAAKYKIDPERIGVWGFSAGGWLVQNLCPSDAGTLVPIREKGAKKEDVVYAPMIDPRANAAGPSARVQALVTDWGAGTLAKNGIVEIGGPWLGVDDPPLLTCHNDKTGALSLGAQTYKDAGAIAEVAFLDVTNTHVPKSSTPAKLKSGAEATWQGRIHEFLDEYVKHPKVSTAPEIVPERGMLLGPARVVLRSVHPDARVYYTVDGSVPTERSAVYGGPIDVPAGATIRAVAVKPGLQISAVASATLATAKVRPPVIETRERAFEAKVGQAFSAKFTASGGGEGPAAVRWGIAGKPGASHDKSNPPKLVPMFAIDGASGVLSGTPEAPGTCVFLVIANVRDGANVWADAVSVIVQVKE